MKRSLKRTLTHSVGALLGICLAIAMGVRSADSGASSSSGASRKGHGIAASAVSGEDTHRVGPDRRRSVSDRLSSGDFRKAWDAIGFRNLTVRERVALQKEVLAAWAAVDLRCALRAAYDGPWDGGDDEGGIDALMGSFQKAFSERPLESWQLLNSQEFKLGLNRFYDAWVASIRPKDREVVFALMGEMTASMKRTAVIHLMGPSVTDPALRAELLRRFSEMSAELRPADLVAEALSVYLSPETPEVLRERLLAAGTEAERMVALQELAYSLWNKGSDLAKAEWAKLPPEQQASTALSLFKSPAAASHPTQVLDLLMQSGQWQTFKDPAAQNHLRNSSKTGSGVDIASWGMTLPARPETVEIFRRAVDPYISRNIGDARGWIESLPSGWHRDRALAQYSQHALYGSKDAGLSAWALDSIEDPSIRAEASRWREEWERKRLAGNPK